LALAVGVGLRRRPRRCPPARDDCASGPRPQLHLEVSPADRRSSTKTAADLERTTGFERATPHLGRVIQARTRCGPLHKGPAQKARRYQRVSDRAIPSAAILDNLNLNAPTAPSRRSPSPSTDRTAGSVARRSPALSSRSRLARPSLRRRA